MGGIAALIVAAIVGAVVAGGATFGLVTSRSAVPAPIEKPYVVYGSTS